MGRRKQIRTFIRTRSSGAEAALVESLVDEVLGWGRVRHDEFMDRGSGPTGLRLYRVEGDRRVRFMNVFPGKSLQFASDGTAFRGVELRATNGGRSRLLTLRLDDPAAVADEARMLAAFAFWSVGPKDAPTS
jgi:hypothetical protein